MHKKENSRKSDTSSLKTVIEELLKSYKIKDKFDESKLITNWEQIMGTMIARRTEKLYVKNKVLYVHISSPALKNELNIAKQKVMNLIQEHAGAELIKEVKFI